MGTRETDQPPLWIATSDLPTSPGHPFYARLTTLLDGHHFDRFVEGLCDRFYAPVMGRPSLAPGRYFRLLLVGYWRCCAVRKLTRNAPLPTDPLTTDRVRRRPTKLSHLIEDVTCEDGLRLLPRPTARSKALPDDQLVPEEGVLHTGLLMVARVLLPLSPSSLLHLSDRAVARGRSWSPSRHGGCPGRWNDDRRATRTRSLVRCHACRRPRPP